MSDEDLDSSVELVSSKTSLTNTESNKRREADYPVKALISQTQKKPTPRGETLFYLIESTFSGGDKLSMIWRCSAEIDALRSYLVSAHPMVIVPPLPRNQLHERSGGDATPDDMEERLFELNIFFSDVLHNLKLAKDLFLSGFLCQEAGWAEAVLAMRLPALPSYGGCGDQRVAALASYHTVAGDYLSNAIRLQDIVATRHYGLYKLRANYARVFSQLSQVMAAPLRGQLLTAAAPIQFYSDSCDTLLTEERQHWSRLRLTQKYSAAALSACAATADKLEPTKQLGLRSLLEKPAPPVQSLTPEEADHLVSELEEEWADLQPRIRDRVTQQLTSVALSHVNMHKQGRKLWENIIEILECGDSSGATINQGD